MTRLSCVLLPAGLRGRFERTARTKACPEVTSRSRDTHPVGDRLSAMAIEISDS